MPDLDFFDCINLYNTIFFIPPLLSRYLLLYIVSADRIYIPWLLLIQILITAIFVQSLKRLIFPFLMLHLLLAGFSVFSLQGELLRNSQGTCRFEHHKFLFFSRVINNYLWLLRAKILLFSYYLNRLQRRIARLR
jgi:hypothetical protein